MTGLSQLKRADWQVVGVAIAFFVLTFTLLFNRYYSFYASYDQGIFNQVFWNNLHGNFFQSSLSSNLSTNVVHQGDVPDVTYHRLGQHFTPALLLWVPFYALAPSPLFLSLLQVSLITGAGLVLYGLACHRLPRAIAVMITISFYGANTVLGPTLGNFHDLCQIPLYVFGLLFALEKRWWWLFTGLALLIPLVREDAGILLFGVGIHQLVKQHNPRIGAALCIYSFTYMALLTGVIMPLFSEDISRRFMIEVFGQYVEAETASPLEILLAMLRQPFLLLRELISPVSETIRYFLGHWLPLAFIPAISLDAWILAAFPLLKLLLADGNDVLSINIRYVLTVLPGLFYGAILWWSRHPQMFKPQFKRFWSLCIALSLLFTITSNPNRTLWFVIPDSIDPWVQVSLGEQWRHAAQMRPLVNQIPPDASVSATTYLVPPLSSRRAIIRFPELKFRNDEQVVMNVDYAIADLWQLQQYQAAFDSDRDLLETSLKLIPRLLQREEYGVIGVQDGVVLLQHGVPSDPTALRQWRKFRREALATLDAMEDEG